MAEYIKREDALEIVMRTSGDYVAAWTEIAHMAAADVAEVRHGRWIPSDMGGGEPDEAYVCSECGEPWTLIDGTPAENNMRYCPACGARMDKEAAHEVPEP